MVDDSPAKGAIIQLYQVQNDSLVSYCISSSNGFFEIKNDISYTGFYKIRISHFSAIDTSLHLNCLQLENNKWNKTIFLKRRVENMQEIIIKAPKINFKLNGDTITYEAEKYMKSDVRKVEDLLKNSLQWERN